jgi:hypothetical protein
MNLTPVSTSPRHRASPTASTLSSGRSCTARLIKEITLSRLPRAGVLVAAAGCRYPGRRGLLAVVAWGAWFSAAGQAPSTPVARPETVAVRGVVLDDSLNVPIPGLWLYLNNTKYGAITNERGEFAFSFPTAWKPVRGGILDIKVVTIPYTFKMMRVPLDWRTHDPAQPLTLRLASAPGRGRPNLHGSILIAPPVPPPVYPARLHTARP